MKDNNFFLLFLLLVTAAVASVYIYLHKAKTINAQTGDGTSEMLQELNVLGVDSQNDIRQLEMEAKGL